MFIVIMAAGAELHVQQFGEARDTKFTKRENSKGNQKKIPKDKTCKKIINSACVYR